MSDTNELDRLRADLEAIERHELRSLGLCSVDKVIEKIESRIAKLEAEAADPWADAKRIVSHWQDCPESNYGHTQVVVAYVDHLEADNAKQAAKIVALENDLKGETLAGQIIRDDLKARIAELENLPEFNPGDYAMAKKALWHWRDEGDELQKEIAEYVLFLLAGISQRNRREMESQKRIAQLEARPVPPLDPKRVIATACKVIAKDDPHAAGYLLQVMKAGDAGIYPLAGDEPT